MRIGALVLAAGLVGPALAGADPAMECDDASQVETGDCVNATLAHVDAALELFGPGV